MKILSHSTVSHALTTRTLVSACALSIAIAVSGCSSNNTAATSMTGNVSAPGGSIAFNPPGTLERMFASILGSSAHAAISGVSKVGAGVTIELIEVDADGNKVGDTLASTTTDASGAYSLTPPAGFVADAKYVIRATGSTETLDVRVTSTTSNDVDPVTDATSDLVTSQFSDLTKISTDEIVVINDAVDAVAQNVDATSLGADALSTALQTEAKNDEETINQISSTSSDGKICGNVKDSNGANLQNITIVARDYGSWVTRSKIKTDSSGNYCVNLLKEGDTDTFTGTTVNGQYIIGALNHTSASYAASQWWTSTSTTSNGSGGANNQFSAGKVTISSASTGETANFVLDANGARITGTVSTHDSGSAEGIKVLLREYDTFKPLAGARIKADGTYRLNVKASKDYSVSFRNRTLNKAYASEFYPNVHMRNRAGRVTVTAKTDTTINPTLEAGGLIRGTVYTSAAKTTPAKGTIVTIRHPNYNGTVDRSRTNKLGKFRYWTLPALTYSVDAMGQLRSKAIVAGGTTNNTGIEYARDVASITGKLYATKSDGSIDTTKPVSELFVRVSPIKTASVKGYVNSNSASEDGSFTVYVDNYIQDGTATPSVTADAYAVYARADSQVTYGSGVYSAANTMDKTTYASVATINPTLGNSTDLGNIKVPSLGDSNGGVGYLIINAGMDAVGVRVGVGGKSNGTRFMSTASRGDKTAKLTLPAGTYVIYRHVYTAGTRTVSASNGAACTGVVIANGGTKTVTFGADDSTSCTES